MILAMGALDTDYPQIYGVLNTANYDVMGYTFVAGNTAECLETIGCFPEDIERAEQLKVGEALSSEWTSENAVIIVKIKDERVK